MPESGEPLRSVLGCGIQQLRDAGIEEPRREALRLWAEVSGTTVTDVQARLHVDVERVQVVRFREAARRRARGEPLSYVTGCVGFRHLSLRIDRRALIPRPETEGLVELLLQRVRSGVVADVGTGSGCIALSLATEGEFTQVVAVDSSEEALALARTNSKLRAGGCSVEYVRADLCTPLRTGGLQALISNPPYLTHEEYAGLDRSVRDWEPALALVGGSDGLEVTRRLIDQGRDVLAPGGWLAVEVDCSRARSAARIANEYGWGDVTIHRDLFGRERYLLARRSDTR